VQSTSFGLVYHLTFLEGMGTPRRQEIGVSPAGLLPRIFPEEMFWDSPGRKLHVLLDQTGFGFAVVLGTGNLVSPSWPSTAVSTAHGGERIQRQNLCSSDNGPFFEESAFRDILGITELHSASWKVAIFMERTGRTFPTVWQPWSNCLGRWDALGVPRI
jgi:hypothetical protein